MSAQANTILRQEEATGPASWPARFAQFGRFHVDFRREELYRDGQRVKVQTKIYHALLVLLGLAGEIVSREEVGKSLWPEAARVNLDANVNTTINKLRLVLGDSSENPTYIETVPRRGYIFVAAVKFSEERPNIVCDRSAKAATESSGALSAWKQRLRSYLHVQPTPLRIASFVLIGMLMGALLVLAWNFVSDKQQATEELGRANASINIPPQNPYKTTPN